jgi:hypothetical protein
MRWSAPSVSTRVPTGWQVRHTRSDDEVSFWRGSITQNTHPRRLRRQLRHDRSALRGATVPTFGDAGGPVVSAGAGGAELADQLSLGGVQVSG